MERERKKTPIADVIYSNTNEMEKIVCSDILSGQSLKNKKVICSDSMCCFFPKELFFRELFDAIEVAWPRVDDKYKLKYKLKGEERERYACVALELACKENLVFRCKMYESRPSGCKEFPKEGEECEYASLMKGKIKNARYIIDGEEFPVPCFEEILVPSQHQSRQEPPLETCGMQKLKE